MEQSGIELARLDASGRKATARSEMERSGIELVRLDASVRKATARSEMERSGIELHGSMRPAANFPQSLPENRSICYPISSEVFFMNYTYVVTCRDGSLYTGWTNDLEKRIKAHNEGKGAKYTKSRRPVVLTYYEEYESREAAMKREYEIKHLSRQKKLKLINSKTIQD